MEIENHKEEVPFEHYRELFLKADSAEMAARTGAKYEDGKFTVNLLGTEYTISHPEYEIATGSDGSAAGGGRSDQSEWPRSADDEAALSARKMPGTATGCRATLAMTGEDKEIATNPSVTAGAVPPPFTREALPPLPVQTFLLRYLLEGKEVAWQGGWKTFREMPWGELYIKPYTGRVLTRAAFTFGTRVDAFAASCEKMGATKLSHGDAGYEFDFLGGYKMRIMVWAGDEEFPPNAQVLYSDNFETGFAPEDRVVAGDILISVIKSNM